MAMSTPDAPISEVPAISEEEVETHFTISIFFFKQKACFSLGVSFLFFGKVFFS